MLILAESCDQNAQTRPVSFADRRFGGLNGRAWIACAFPGNLSHWSL
jgi:hypothetical protein